MEHYLSQYLIAQKEVYDETTSCNEFCFYHNILTIVNRSQNLMKLDSMVSFNLSLTFSQSKANSFADKHLTVVTTFTAKWDCSKATQKA